MTRMEVAGLVAGAVLIVAVIWLVGHHPAHAQPCHAGELLAFPESRDTEVEPVCFQP